MLRWSLVLCLVACAGGRDAKPKASAEAEPAAAQVPSGFIEISMDDDDDDDDFFPELKQAMAPCGDLMLLEPSAMMGKLKDPEIRCLDQGMRDAERMTVKDKISRVLMKDAYAKGDEHRWGFVAKRHLEEIDRSDPDLCYKYTKYLLGKPVESMDESMRWADVALENRSRWTGDMHVSRVYNLYKFKTLAAQKQWMHFEEEALKDMASAVLQTSKDDARNLTKTLAREWLEYAKQSGRDTTAPMQLCMQASGTANYCEQT